MCKNFETDNKSFRSKHILMSIQAKLRAAGGSLSKKSAFQTQTTINKGDMVVDFTPKESYVPKPISFSITNGTGDVAYYNLGVNTALANNHPETLAAPTSIAGGKYTMAALRDEIGSASYIIKSISYRTSSNTAQFDQPFEVRTGNPQKFDTETLEEEIAEAQSPEANNDKYLKIVPRGKMLFYSKAVLYSLGVLNGETVTIRFNFSGVEGRVVAVG